ncbi:MAG: polysaccharide deacetylase family protein [Bacillaceae bacterium]|nr:polysaccharide deacetylase family protein [Bacillaceae bacterium]
MLILASCNQQQGQQGEESRQKRQETQQQQDDQKNQTEQRNQKRTPDLAGGKEKEVREPHPLSLADLRQKYPSTFVLNGPSNKRQVALTFDDGPDLEYTPQILDVLKQYNVKATFFVVGNRAEAHPEIVRRMHREGHEIANHTYSHPHLIKVDDVTFQREVRQTDGILRPLIGYSPKLFRPPYGDVTEDQIKWLSSQNYTIVNWNVDSLDWKGLSQDQVSVNVLSHVFPGSIILQHSAGGKGEDLSGTVKALPEIIQKLRADGVQFVTTSELLNLPRSR